MDYSSTYKLAQDIRDSEEYRTYHELKDSVMKDETTAALITEYRKLQMTLQMAAAAGATPYASSAYTARTFPARISLVTLRKVSMTSS